MSEHEVKIIVAGQTDAKRCAALMNAIMTETQFLARGPDDSLLSAKTLKQTLLAESQQHTVFLAIQNGVPVGYLTATKGEYVRLSACIRISMAVRRSAAAQGIGGALLHACDAWAQNNDIARIELIVMVANSPAIHLYERHGYQTEGTRRRSIRIDGVDLDQLLMAKLLG